jgi:hypothetical protein
MCQNTKQLNKGRKFDKTEKKKSHISECPVRVDKKKEFLKKRGIGFSKKKSYQCECPLNDRCTAKVAVSNR